MKLLFREIIALQGDNRGCFAIYSAGHHRIKIVTQCSAFGTWVRVTMYGMTPSCSGLGWQELCVITDCDNTRSIPDLEKESKLTELCAEVEKKYLNRAIMIIDGE